jgi:orotate phosphoribosyltransferase
MQREHILRLFKQSEVIVKGHFVLSSKWHSDTYINKDAIFAHPDLASLLCRELAFSMCAAWHDVGVVDVVVGPEKGGIIMSQWVAYHLEALSSIHGKTGKVFAAYAEKSGEEFVFRRRFSELVNGKSVVVVEDVLTTGQTMRKVMGLVRSVGGSVEAIGVLCNRDCIDIFDVIGVRPWFSVLDYSLEKWVADQCPLCSRGISVSTDFGRGEEFLAGTLL